MRGGEAFVEDEYLTKDTPPPPANPDIWEMVKRLAERPAYEKELGVQPRNSWRFLHPLRR